MNDTYLFKMPPELPPEAKEILNHLQSTGTGVHKLRLAAELAKQSKSLEEFLAGVKSSLPEGTWKKVVEFISKKTKEAENEKAVKEAIAEAAKKAEPVKSSLEAPPKLPEVEPAPEPSPVTEAPSELPSEPKEEPKREEPKGRNRR